MDLQRSIRLNFNMAAFWCLWFCAWTCAVAASADAGGQQPPVDRKHFVAQMRRVEAGMTETRVTSILGPPDSKVAGQPSSARVNYVTDALGNVMATAYQTGAAQNCNAYKPYGAQLAKTGTAPDPAFTWVGSYSYRQTSKNYSDVYVRAR